MRCGAKCTRFEGKHMEKFETLIYGIGLAWLALALYVASMASRQRKLSREIASVRSMLESSADSRSAN
jgi:CcmD family protein